MLDPSQRVRVGVAQLAVTSDVDKNVAKICTFLQRARGQGLQILCFPEYALNPDLDHWVDLAPAIAQIQAACRTHELWCIFGAEAGGPDARQNSTYLIDPTGTIRQRYVKVHLWQNEKAHFVAGQHAQVIDIGICRIGIICCWDIAFPSFVAALAQQGAEIIFCPSYLCDYAQDQQALRALPLARAFENGVFLPCVTPLRPKRYRKVIFATPRGFGKALCTRKG